MTLISRRALSLAFVCLLLGCSGQQSAIVQHFCAEAIEVRVTWAFGDAESDRYDEGTTLVEPEVPTLVWEGCCDPSPSGTIELSAGDWFYSEKAKNFDDAVITIGEEACVQAPIES